MTARSQSTTGMPLQRWLWAVVFVVAGGLLLWNLDGHYLWQDEAQTALLSRTVLDYGVPVGYDGRNHFSQEQGAEYGPGYLWRWHTWFPFYLLAGFFAVLGESTFVARLPFALLGMAAIGIASLTARTIWNDRRAALAAAALLAVHVPFLILSRQCRYYSPAAFLTVLGLLGYWQLMSARRLSGPIYAAAVALLFHTHYVYVAAVVPALWIHAAFWHRDRVKPLALWTAVAALFCLPWIVWLAGMKYGQQYGQSLFDPQATLARLGTFLTKTNDHILPAAILLVPLLAALIRRRQGIPLKLTDRELWRGASCLLLVSAALVLLLSLVAPAPFFRYLAPLIPVLAVLAGRIIAAAWGLHWLAGLVLYGLLAIRFPLSDYIYELTHEFNGPAEGIVEYLRAHADEDDVVAVTSGDLPIKFYTGLRVVGGLTGEDLQTAVDADWIIIRRDFSAGREEARVRPFLESQIQKGGYEPIVLSGFPDTPYENREEPSEHLFRTAESVPPVVIWKRVRRGPR